MSDDPSSETVTGEPEGGLEVWSDVPTAVLSDELAHHGVVAPRLSPIAGARRFAGRALTIRVSPSARAGARDALRMAWPGSVIVVDAGTHGDAAVWGGNLAAIARARGVCAVVVDGFVRDVAELRESGLAVYARGVTPLGPPWTGIINEPVTCGGQAVAPGDLVVGDEDGIVVVPAAGSPDLLARCLERARREDAYQSRVAALGWPAADAEC